MKKALLPWFWLLAALTATAQPDTTFRWQHRGYVNQMEMGVMMGQVSVDNSPPTGRVNFTFTGFNGYRLHRLLAVGLAVGLDWYRTRMLLPVSLGLRGDFWRARRVVPFYALDVGYGSTALMRNCLLYTSPSPRD